LIGYLQARNANLLPLGSREAIRVQPSIIARTHNYGQLPFSLTTFGQLGVGLRGCSDDQLHRGNRSIGLR